MSHYLNVELFEGENSNQEFDRWIDHEDDCPTESREMIGVEINPEFPDFEPHYHVYTCGVGYWEEMYGYEDLEEDPRFTTPGKYEIDFYNEQVFQSYEWDSYLYFVKREDEDYGTT